MILDRYLMRQFLPVFAVAAAMFVMLLSLMDLFANLWRYLNYEVPFKEILRVSLYYLPQSFSYALPISLLFAAAYTLGDLYARNELTSIFASGIPFWRFSISLVVMGLMASVFAFYFGDRVVVPTLRIKNDLQRLYLHQQRTENNSDIVIKARNGEVIYQVDYYDSATDTLNGISIVEQTSGGSFIALVRAPQGTWTGEYWKLSNAMIYQWEDGLLRVRPLEDPVDYRERPDTFRRNAMAAEDLPVREAGLLVRDLKAAGLPFIGAQAEYYHRYSFSTVSLVIMILSISMGGRFRKNVMLMSLLTSLGSAVVFYVAEMITMMMAKLGYIPPIMGAWFPVLVFIILGILMVRSAKT
ncbi:membrane protein [Spirochaetia bacterium]|nr:membrane protein [Spirochaetia bacterium]